MNTSRHEAQIPFSPESIFPACSDVCYTTSGLPVRPGSFHSDRENIRKEQQSVSRHMTADSPIGMDESVKAAGRFGER